jgi:hypothetical protein
MDEKIMSFSERYCKGSDCSDTLDTEAYLVYLVLLAVTTILLPLYRGKSVQHRLADAWNVLTRRTTWRDRKYIKIFVL